MIFYNLMTLNAAAMIDNAVVRLRESKHNYQPEFCYDFNDSITKNLILNSVDQHADNALYYQMIECICGADSIDEYRTKKDILKRSLIYLDFKDIFSSQAKKENKRKQSTFSINDWKDKAIDEKCEVLFQDGFSIVFEDGEVKTYIPFDKSGNMSRNFSITFIDCDVFDDVDERIRMGIDFNSLKVVLSKYYAYRGLYLTDSSRIPEEDNFVLNHETVLIIDDASHDYMRKNEQGDLEPQQVPVITADKESLLEGKWEVTTQEKTIRLNSFDGEGIVSPLFAERINLVRQQEVQMRNTAVSFQIRMPFIKGMLHQVDFQQFFEDNGIDDTHYIRDIFGIPRKLKDAQIILTKSMFKCAAWLEDIRKTHPDINDPVEWYFREFHKYHHALYVGNTDANMGSHKVTLNYQFINTLDLTARELDELVTRHVNEAHSISKTGSKYAVDLGGYLSDLLFEEDEATPAVPAWRYALDLNPDFVKDPHVRSMLKMDELARIKDICSGRILVNGVLKYLSGDLLAFLIHMIYKKQPDSNQTDSEYRLGRLNGNDFIPDVAVADKIVKKYQSQMIGTERFFVADYERLHLRSGKRYGILRSPHLSRNEQCALRAYTPDIEDRSNAYTKYFGHLKNVIMVAYESVDAMSLGGADYDGDKVKLFLDAKVNDSILRGAYELKGKDYQRKYPIVDIPSLPADKDDVPRTISYNVVRQTFSNQVGLISDLAIKKGKILYAESGSDDPANVRCAECTLATGLEIDAVKTGVRPNLSRIKENTPSGKDPYLWREDAIDDYDNISRLKVARSKETGSNGGTLFVAKKPIYQKGKKAQLKKLMDAEVMPLDATGARIDRLPGYLLQALAGEYQEEKKSSEKRQRENLLFKFQATPNTGEVNTKWKKELVAEPGAEEKLEKLSALIKAYRKVAVDASWVRKQKEKANRSNYVGKIWTRLETIYDISTEVLPQTHTSIPDAIGIAHSDFRDIFETVGVINEAIKRMEDFEWFLAAADERESVLYKILSTENLREETKEILLTEEENGFELLKFFLFEIRDEKIAEQAVDTIENEDGSKKSLKGYSADDYEELIREYLIGQENKESKSIWNSRVINLCREKLSSPEFFNGDFDKALRYYYACRASDPSRLFMWDVFQTGEIIRNVFIKSRE